MEITSELKDLVIKEATNLKKYAHADELAKLDFSRFDGQYITTCFYGQMTGHCTSERASELILKCCSKTFRAVEGSPSDGKLNGKPSKNRISDNLDGVQINYWSPLEVMADGADREDLKPIIDFLKGETETLTL